MITHQSHPSKLSYRFINIPTILCHLLVIVECEQLLIVGDWKGKVLEFAEDRSTRMVLLLMRKPQVSHVLAQDVDTI